MVRLAAIAISIYILYHLDSCSIWNVKGKKYRNRELKTRSSRIDRSRYRLSRKERSNVPPISYRKRVCRYSYIVRYIYLKKLL